MSGIWLTAVAAVLLVAHTDALSVRFVTWNVLSNKWMGGEFEGWTLDKLLGPITQRDKTFHKHDIYVVSVQENCYQCNDYNKEKLAAVFLKVLKRFGPYRFVAISMTRNSNKCQWFHCKTWQHGTVATMLFAREGLLTADEEVHVNGCDSKIIHNAEKGIAGFRTVVKSNKQSLCFAGLHLDYKRLSSRKRCMEKFFEEAREDHKWAQCDVVMIGGDFNSRPGPKEYDGRSESVSWTAFGAKFIEELKHKDELTGSSPYGGETFIHYINVVSKFHFQDGPISFKPTYSVQPQGSCSGEAPCLKGNRTPGWTDRILCSGCRSRDLYMSMLFGKSDHDPVVGVFQV